MVVLYGIPNCDKVRAARKWLKAHNIEHRFHDFRKDGVTGEQLGDWSKKLGQDALINRRGTTWRQLPESTRTNMDGEEAIRIMQSQPSIIKRPILETDTRLLSGFSDSEWREALGLEPA